MERSESKDFGGEMERKLKVFLVSWKRTEVNILAVVEEEKKSFGSGIKKMKMKFFTIGSR